MEIWAESTGCPVRLAPRPGPPTWPPLRTRRSAPLSGRNRRAGTGHWSTGFLEARAPGPPVSRTGVRWTDRQPRPCHHPRAATRSSYRRLPPHPTVTAASPLPGSIKLPAALQEPRVHLVQQRADRIVDSVGLQPEPSNRKRMRGVGRYLLSRAADELQGFLVIIHQPPGTFKPRKLINQYRKT